VARYVVPSAQMVIVRYNKSRTHIFRWRTIRVAFFTTRLVNRDSDSFVRRHYLIVALFRLPVHSRPTPLPSAPNTATLGDGSPFLIQSADDAGIIDNGLADSLN